MSEQAITNSACLIALERIGQLDLLRQVFDTVFAPTAVQAEFGVSLDWLVVKGEIGDELAKTQRLTLPASKVRSRRRAS